MIIALIVVLPLLIGGLIANAGGKYRLGVALEEMRQKDKD